MRQPPVTIGHTGIRVVDIDKMVGFYTRVFGLNISDRADDDRMVFLSSDPADHHQLFFVKGGPEDASQSRLAHVAFRIRDMDMLRDLYKRLKKETEVRDMHTVTHGNAWSVYFQDPEGNTAEAFVDTPWHVAQPFRKPLPDLFEMSDAELHAWTDKMLEEYPTRRPFEDWREDLAKKVGMTD